MVRHNEEQYDYDKWVQHWEDDGRRMRMLTSQRWDDMSEGLQEWYTEQAAAYFAVPSIKQRYERGV